MINDIAVVMAAIQAAIRLGGKIRTIYAEETRDRDLVLPLVEVPELPHWGVVKEFFDGPGRAFVTGEEAPPGKAAAMHGLYCQWWRKQDEDRRCRDHLRRAYLSVQQELEPLRGEADVDRGYRQPDSFYAGANALLRVKQWRDGADPKRSPVQRLAGTLIEIALDYVKVDPTLFGGNGIGDRMVRAFLLSLDDVDFAESDYDDLLLDVMRAALETFRLNMDMAISEEHLADLLGQVSRCLTRAIDTASQSGDDDKLRALYRLRRDLLQDVVQVSARTASQNLTAFVGTADSRGRQVLENVLRAVLDTIASESDLIDRRTLTDTYAAALRAVAQNPALLLAGETDGPDASLLGTLIVGIGTRLADSAAADPPGILTPEIFTDVVSAALAVLARHLPTLGDPSDPQRQLLVDALQGLVISLGDDFHAGRSLTALLESFFTRSQRVELVRIVFAAVARNPDGLLQDAGRDPRRTALAQVAGSVAAAISTDAKRFLNGENFLDLFRVALNAAAVNPDRLFNLDSADPRDNVMAQVIVGVIQAVIKNAEVGGRNLLNGRLLVDAVQTALAVVSKNVDGFLQEPEIVGMVMDRLLAAAANVLVNELDGENLLRALGEILPVALLGRTVLDASDADLILGALQ